MADEQWNIDTDGLRVGGKLWNGERGWLVIVRLAPGKVWVRPDKLSASTALTGAQPAPAAPSGYDGVTTHPEFDAAPAAQPADSAMEVLRELVEAQAEMEEVIWSPVLVPELESNARLRRRDAAWDRARALTAAKTHG